MSPAFAQSPDLGLFSNHGDVGSVQKPGSAEFDSAKGTYLIGGGGENMWSTNDAFHFVWNKMSGDVALSANIRWIGTEGNPHRKACLIIRQSLDPNSAYADAALHGSGLTCLQYRESPGAPTREIQSAVAGPARLRIEKRGAYVSLYIAGTGETLHPAGGSFRLQLDEPFYVGLGVCAHDNTRFEQAEFSNVEITPLSSAPAVTPAIECTIETFTLDSMERQVIYHTTNHIEAPNWSRDGTYLLFNQQGRIYRLPATGGQPSVIDTGDNVHCNNDHGISPDGKLLAISDQTGKENKSHVYVLPIDGGTPRRITPKGPSYWHGWSPDGKTLAYCADRKGNFDVYTIPVSGGKEKRLTTAPGLDDGPEYSPDGKFIYFNSVRTGLMQIWRMKPDGSNQEQVTNDEYNNWFAHPSPDGKWIVFLTFPKDVEGHPANKDVMLRLMPTAGGPIQVLTKFFGGQGTINVPSWSPDSLRFAFVSYLPVYP
jgi:Tol biopolymer transport system component